MAIKISLVNQSFSHLDRHIGSPTHKNSHKNHRRQDSVFVHAPEQGFGSEFVWPAAGATAVFATATALGAVGRHGFGYDGFFMVRDCCTIGVDKVCSMKPLWGMG
jgi:hypothetical protein